MTGGAQMSNHKYNEQDALNIFLADWRDLESGAIAKILYAVIVDNRDDEGYVTEKSKTAMQAIIAQAGGENPFSDLSGGEDYRPIWTALAALAKDERQDVISFEAVLEKLHGTQWTREELNNLIKPASIGGAIAGVSEKLDFYFDKLRDFKSRQRCRDNALALSVDALNRALPLDAVSKEMKSTLEHAEQASQMKDKKKDKLVFVSASDFLSMELPPVEPIIDPIWNTKEGIMIFAKPGIGKTYLSLTMAMAISAGDVSLFNGRWKVGKPYVVAYLDGEMPARDLQKRIQLLAKGGIPYNGERLRIFTGDLQTRRIPNFATDDGQAMLEPFLKGVDVVFWDNLSCLFGVADENDNSKWAPTLNWFIDLRRRGMAMAEIHHANKSPEGDFSGAGALARSIATNIKLERPEKQHSQGACFNVLFTKGRSMKGGALHPFSLELRETDNGGLEWLIGGISKNEEKELQVTDLVGQGKKYSEIEKITGVSRSGISRIMKKRHETKSETS